jgi:N4-(beta-N-acetylglucosaminyl)-L-asparaginase
MGHRVSRRDFVRAGTGLAASAVASPAFAGQEGRGPAVVRSARPVVIASANGNKYRNGGPRTSVEEAFLRITRGEDVLEALVAGVNICELDPADDSVGYGGLPNALGVVQLDASVMHGPRRRAGAVAALEGVRTPSSVAKAVADLTDHHLLVGAGAQEFARSLGFAIEPDLNTEHSRKLWLEWKRRTDPDHYPDPASREEAGRKAGRRMIEEGLVDPEHHYGTINCNGLGAKGEVCGVTTTSGLSWKIPGRVGDSPILGAGLWVDGEVGAAGSTGRGEANLFNLSSFLIVEEMRRGRHPKDAALEALRRIRANTVEKRLLNSKGNPDFNVTFYALDRAGRYAGVSLYGGANRSFAVCTENGPQTLPCDFLLAESESDARPTPAPPPPR